MSEIELHVLNMQCLKRHIPTIEKIKQETEAWQKHRNNKLCKIKNAIKNYLYFDYIRGDQQQHFLTERCDDARYEGFIILTRRVYT